MLLRIAVDLRPLLEPFEGGVTIYTKAIVDEFIKLKNVQLDLFYQSTEPCDRIHEMYPRVRHLAISNTKFHLQSIFKFRTLPRGYFEKKPHLIWIPDRRPFYRTRIPLFMTIHDSVPEKMKLSLSIKSRVWHTVFSLKRLLSLCDGVLVPSFTAAIFLPRNINKEVTYEGANLSKTELAPKNSKRIKKRPFFLMIAPSDPRKRVKWMLEMAKIYPKVNFVVAGTKSKDRRFARTKFRKLKNVYSLGQISEPEKKWLLKRATALLALSNNEGFDLPVLEALRVKCPVIMSDIPVHQELYKSCFVKNRFELRAEIHRALNGRYELAKPRGDYTWEKAANRMLLFFRRIVFDKDG